MNIKKIIWDKALHYLNRFFPHIRKQIISFSYLSKYYGQYNSIKKNATVDSKDNAIPWLTYPAIEYLGNLDFTSENVLEVGSGNSTIWFSKQAKNVVSLESDHEWYEITNKKVKNLENTEVFHYENLNTKQNLEKFDNCTVAFIDCISLADRLFVLDYFTEHINKLNIKLIIVDNTDNPELYTATQKFVKETNWVDVELVGFGPQNRYVWSTSILINPNNRVLRKNQSINPIKNTFK